ncbi:MAG: NADH:ubiquinone reductase (Na(+)-transporting) subunit B [Bacteroidetes bacterium CG2_30_33_31]|nr:MAG: NADH:ubiquinone reductase (Na(+)-transporting) subunit B [Bacteroidetes bacterium CG2_30_33_31]
MKPIRNILDAIKPHVQKDGKFHAFHSFYDAIETLFFVQDRVTSKGSHIRDGVDMKRTMFVVVIALMPALFFGMWNAGNMHFKSMGMEKELMENFWYGFLKILPIIIVSYAVGLGIEIAFAQKRGHEVNEGFFVSGMLIPLIVPVTTPLWMVAIAVAFAVIFGKEVFGGTGMNIMNPALLTRAFLFFAYPTFMSGDKVWIAEKADAFSGATPLAELTAGHPTGISVAEMFIGNYSGSFGETSTIAILIGAFILLYTGVASWKVMVSFFVGGLSMGLLLNGLSASFPANAYLALPAWQHLLIGGFAFGGVFMITDPVTASQTGTGKWIYGFLGGFIAIMVRVLNPAYPEGVMLAILLVNIFAPLIDYYVVESNIKRRLKRVKALS